MLYVCAGVKGDPRKALVLLELELQEAGSHHVGAGDKPGCSAGVASAFNHGATSPALNLCFDEKKINSTRKSSRGQKPPKSPRLGGVGSRLTAHRVSQSGLLTLPLCGAGDSMVGQSTQDLLG